MPALHPQRRTMTAREAAERTGVSRSTICALVAEPRDAYLARAQQRRNRVIALRLQGLRYREITEQTGETPGNIANHLRRARLYGEWDTAHNTQLATGQCPHCDKPWRKTPRNISEDKPPAEAE